MALNLLSLCLFWQVAPSYCLGVAVRFSSLPVLSGLVWSISTFSFPLPLWFLVCCLLDVSLYFIAIFSCFLFLGLSFSCCLYSSIILNPSSLFPLIFSKQYCMSVSCSKLN